MNLPIDKKKNGVHARQVQTYSEPPRLVRRPCSVQDCDGVAEGIYFRCERHRPAVEPSGRRQKKR